MAEDSGDATLSPSFSRLEAHMRRAAVVIALAVSTAGVAAAARLAAQNAPRPPSGTRLEYHRLVPGFVREVFNDDGMARGTGFEAPNPWGRTPRMCSGRTSRGSAPGGSRTTCRTRTA